MKFSVTMVLVILVGFSVGFSYRTGVNHGINIEKTQLLTNADYAVAFQCNPELTKYDSGAKCEDFTLARNILTDEYWSEQANEWRKYQINKAP